MNNARTIISNSGCLNLKQDIRPNIGSVREKRKRNQKVEKEKGKWEKRRFIFAGLEIHT